MDPLSITAAVVGLVAATARVASLISGCLSKTPSASDQIRQILSDIGALKTCLCGLQTLFVGTNLLPSSRQSMIQVDHLALTLTETILTIDELENLSNSASSGFSILFDMKENQEVNNIARKLKRHKSSLSLILNILQCHSDLEARSAQHNLHKLVEQLLLSNLDISRRLKSLEDVNSVQSDLKSCLEEHQDEENAMDDLNSMQSGHTDITLPSTVHDALYTSRVYKRTRMYESDVSFSTSTLRPHAFSVFSELTLSDISSLSVIALPLYLADVSNGEYYHFGEYIDTEKASIGLSKTPTNSTSSSFSTQGWLSDAPLEFTWYDASPENSSRQSLGVESPAARSYRLIVLGDINSGKIDLVKQVSYIVTY
ncbi:hypothetical protein BJ875DRAFT_510847 [Amylocarpus encephaloides]|uniref:Fungal N-terminal domain-containing protein n=1 Tax=Amylocarpus encephaloides TaxID=45428 RepID=A0A9P7YHL9_9HELO|nr:hypothetical protein BJ875DRAFT_510847 [Amylocarpus encephaloides]